jgi:hypothetical protein
MPLPTVSTTRHVDVLEMWIGKESADIAGNASFWPISMNTKMFCNVFAMFFLLFILIFGT